MSFNIPTKTMSCILHIETSTDVCSVALSQDGVCLHEEIDTNGRRHAEILAPFVEEAVSFADSHAIPLDAVSVSAGPGSYTGLRIGVSTAKGLCYGRDLKLISIPTLKVLCTPILLYREDIPDNALLCPMIDARRMEVYTAIYDRALHEVVPTDAVIVNENSFAEILDKQPVFFFGNGADKCRDTLKHPNAHFIEGIVPKASNMLPLAGTRPGAERDRRRCLLRALLSEAIRSRKKQKPAKRIKNALVSAHTISPLCPSPASAGNSPTRGHRSKTENPTSSTWHLNTTQQKKNCDSPHTGAWCKR